MQIIGLSLIKLSPHSWAGGLEKFPVLPKSVYKNILVSQLKVVANEFTDAILQRLLIKIDLKDDADKSGKQIWRHK